MLTFLTALGALLAAVIVLSLCAIVISAVVVTVRKTLRG